MSHTSLPLCSNPIFILGILQRSGTNYLYNLLRLHPDCEGTVPWEDFLVQYSPILDTYVDSVSGHWLERWGVAAETLSHHLGYGLLSFLTAQVGDKRVITKTPSVQGLPHFFKLFPQAYLLIVVRDGRSLVESGVRSFGWEYEAAIRAWAQAAQTILAFDRTQWDSGHRYLIVRYEDIFGDTEAELGRILTFLQLDSTAYDFAGAIDLPIRGSSTLKQEGQSKVQWNQAVQKTEQFDPTRRWRHWDRARHERFNWLAGEYMRQLGYELEGVVPENGWPKTQNEWRDRWFNVRSTLARKAKSAVRRLPGRGK